MKELLSILSVSFLAIATADLKAERAKLQGSWQLVSETMDGKEQPKEYTRQIQMTFDADGRWRVEKDGKILFRGTSVLDPAKDPKELDSAMTFPEENKGAKVLAIYKVDGDTYTQCWTVGKQRPTAFKADAAAGVNLSVYKRVRSEQG